MSRLDESEVPSIKQIVYILDLNEHVRDKTSTAALSFASLKNDDERVTFMLQLLNKHKLLNFNVIKPLKDETKAIACRISGNECYKKAEFKYAMKYYNESIAHAPVNSETLALAYGNRSAVLFTVKRYEACIQNIDLALKENYPQSAIVKLHIRRRKCEKLLNKKQKTILNFDPKVRYGPNPEIPCASSAVSLKCNDKYGRHIVAARDIKCGDVLAIEPPFCSYPKISQCYINCTNCLQGSLTLIPCLTCCEVMFCDEKCRQEAFDQFHNIECPILPTLLSMGVLNGLISCLHVAVVAFNKYGNELQTIINTAESPDALKMWGFTNQEGGLRIFDSKSYVPIHMLPTNYGKHPLAVQTSRAVLAATMVYLLKKTSTIQDMKMFGALIFRHLMTSGGNFIEIIATSENIFELDQIARCAFAFHGVFNHSCAPNSQIESIFIGGQLNAMSIAVAPIAKGEQIWISYGHCYHLQPKQERQEALLFKWHFKCECIACERDYVIMRYLPTLRNVPECVLPSKEDISMLTAFNVEHVQKILPKFLKHVDCLFSKKPHPNIQVFYLQQAIVWCYQVLCHRSYF